MIKYKLICKDCEISFDSWFSSSREYEKLKKQKFINCHICNSLNVEKTLMSPNILNKKNDYKNDKQIKKYNETRQIILKYQEFIKKNFDYVGANFSYEVRNMYYKNKKVSKGIYGKVTKEDLKELKEEGIDVDVIPWIKGTTN